MNSHLNSQDSQLYSPQTPTVWTGQLVVCHFIQCESTTIFIFVSVSYRDRDLSLVYHVKVLDSVSIFIGLHIVWSVHDSNALNALIKVWMMNSNHVDGDDNFQIYFNYCHGWLQVIFIASMKIEYRLMTFSCLFIQKVDLFVPLL